MLLKGACVLEDVVSLGILGRVDAFLRFSAPVETDNRVALRSAE